MAKRSMQAIPAELEQQIRTALFQVLSDLNRKKDAAVFAEHFFTETELSIFTKRLAVAMLLQKGESYESIGKILKVSSATISSVAESMHKQGFQIALQKLKVDRWADVWSAKLMRMFGSKV